VVSSLAEKRDEEGRENEAEADHDVLLHLFSSHF